MTITTKRKFQTCKNDIVFKMLFCTEESKELLLEFLKRIYRKDIKSINYQPITLKENNLEVKNKNVDLLVTLDNGEIIFIEINASSGKYLNYRNFSYIANKYSNYLKKGSEYIEYTKIPKHTQINFTWGLKNDEIKREYYVQDKNGNKYIDNLEIIEYNMDIAKKKWYTKDEKFIKDYKEIIMLDLSEEELEKIKGSDEFMNNYVDEIKELNHNDRFSDFISIEDDYNMIMRSLVSEEVEKNEKKWKRKAKKDGIKEGIIQTARNLKELGIPIDKIIKSTNLTKEEIEKL